MWGKQRLPPPLPVGQGLPSNPRVGRKSHIDALNRTRRTASDSPQTPTSTSPTAHKSRSTANRATIWTEGSRYSQASWRSSTGDPALLWPSASTMPSPIERRPAGEGSANWPAAPSKFPPADGGDADDESWEAFLREVNEEVDHVIRPASDFFDDDTNAAETSDEEAPSPESSPLSRLSRQHRPPRLHLRPQHRTIMTGSQYLAVPTPTSARSGSATGCKTEGAGSIGDPDGQSDGCGSQVPTPRSPSLSRGKTRAEWRSGFVVPPTWSLQGEPLSLSSMYMGSAVGRLGPS